MIKRILDLAIKSGHIVSDLPLNANEKIQLAGLEKFAELLVKECIGLVEKDIEPELDGSDYAEHWNMALRSASNEIKQHFGVE